MAIGDNNFLDGKFFQTDSLAGSSPATTRARQIQNRFWIATDFFFVQSVPVFLIAVLELWAALNSKLRQYFFDLNKCSFNLNKRIWR